MASAFWKLGLGEPFPVSGLHGSGIAEVLEKMLPHIYQVSSFCSFACLHRLRIDEDGTLME